MLYQQLNQKGYLRRFYPRGTGYSDMLISAIGDASSDPFSALSGQEPFRYMPKSDAHTTIARFIQSRWSALESD
ncbi:hypothetical protein EV182_007654 [Spiromyces aspiralis]|uniref:Uncharacterized protein n=1 Tax=Spiromyces aspiralis TaxID=68401 RepID=A0ACC1HAW7_9FUNG|nr:hypothetical protein EV182_007654 [Spiromyces aspiralis]